MSAHCCKHETTANKSALDLPRYRRVLWLA
jgi:hypothetical protein